MNGGKRRYIQIWEKDAIFQHKPTAAKRQEAQAVHHRQESLQCVTRGMERGEALSATMRKLKQIDKFLFHLLVDVAVSGECFTALLMAGELAYEVGVFDLLV